MKNKNPMFLKASLFWKTRCLFNVFLFHINTFKQRLKIELLGVNTLYHLNSVSSMSVLPVKANEVGQTSWMTYNSPLMDLSWLGIFCLFMQSQAGCMIWNWISVGPYKLSVAVSLGCRIWHRSKTSPVMGKVSKHLNCLIIFTCNAINLATAW